MPLSPITGARIIEMGADGQIETSEVSALIQGVFGSAIFGMMMIFIAKMFIKAFNPPKEEAKEMLEMAEVF